MTELNPEHPVTKKVHDHWHTICLMIMRKLGVNHVVITAKDLETIVPGSLNIVIQELSDGLHVKVITAAEAEALLVEAALRDVETAASIPKVN